MEVAKEKLREAVERTPPEDACPDLTRLLGFMEGMQQLQVGMGAC